MNSTRSLRNTDSMTNGWIIEGEPRDEETQLPGETQNIGCDAEGKQDH